jgi:hypothetical protein
MAATGLGMKKKTVFNQSTPRINVVMLGYGQDQQK